MTSLSARSLKTHNESARNLREISQTNFSVFYYVLPDFSVYLSIAIDRLTNTYSWAMAMIEKQTNVKRKTEV